MDHHDLFLGNLDLVGRSQEAKVLGSAGPGWEVTPWRMLHSTPQKWTWNSTAVIKNNVRSHTLQWKDPRDLSRGRLSAAGA